MRIDLDALRVFEECGILYDIDTIKKDEEGDSVCPVCKAKLFFIA